MYVFMPKNLCIVAPPLIATAQEIELRTDMAKAHESMQQARNEQATPFGGNQPSISGKRRKVPHKKRSGLACMPCCGTGGLDSEMGSSGVGMPVAHHPPRPVQHAAGPGARQQRTSLPSVA